MSIKLFSLHYYVIEFQEHNHYLLYKASSMSWQEVILELNSMATKSQWSCLCSKIKRNIPWFGFRSSRSKFQEAVELSDVVTEREYHIKITTI